MMFFLSGNMEITSLVQPSNDAKALWLGIIDSKYPNFLEMQHPNLNLKKLLVFTPTFFLKTPSFDKSLSDL